MAAATRLRRMAPRVEPMVEVSWEALRAAVKEHQAKSVTKDAQAAYMCRCYADYNRPMAKTLSDQ